MTRKRIASILFGALLAALAAVGFMGGALVHMAGTAPHSADRLTDAETRMLAQALTHPAADGGYNVVMRDTITVPLWADDPGSAYDARDAMVAAFRKQGVDARALMDRLYALNTKSVQLALASSPGDGYVVDDGSYGRYFEFNGGGMRRLTQEHPQVRNVIRLSRPVYDEASGLFLFYVTSGSLGQGLGSFQVYRLENGAFTPVAAQTLWRT